jgi:hypothetical protein
MKGRKQERKEETKRFCTKSLGIFPVGCPACCVAAVISSSVLNKQVASTHILRIG